MKKIISLIIILVLAGLLGVLFIRSPETKPKQIPTPTKNGGLKIIAIGDSLTAGYGLRLDESYPKQLEKKLILGGYDVEVINAGVSGETTAGLLDRLDFIKKQNPKIILITIGGNDALRALPLEDTEKNITAIIKNLKEVLPVDQIFLMQIQSPANQGKDYTEKFNNIYTKISTAEGITLVPFVVPAVFTSKALMQADGIHPNAEGYKYIVDNYVYKAVEEEVSGL